MSELEHRPTSRVLDILELLSNSSEGYTMTEIANAINAPKSSIFPVIHTLSQRKFINIDRETSKYTIGINAFAVGSSYLENLRFLNFITDELQKVVDKSLETCQLAVLDKDKVLYIARVDSPEPIRLISSVGKQLPAYCTALGKALLCDYSIDELKKIYPNGLFPKTSKTITDFKVLHSQLKNIKETNIAAERGEIAEYIQCVAVPIRKDGKVIFAISVSIPVFRVTDEKIDLVKRLLLDSKYRIENILYKINFDISSLTILP